MDFCEPVLPGELIEQSVPPPHPPPPPLHPRVPKRGLAEWQETVQRASTPCGDLSLLRFLSIFCFLKRCQWRLALAPAAEIFTGSVFEGRKRKTE